MSTKMRFILVAALVMLAAAGLVFRQQLQPGPAAPQRVACTQPQAGCNARVAGREVRFGIAGEVRPMQPFEVWVAAPGVERIEASFAMVGMDMGFNRYTLRRAADGTWRVAATLPFCVTGRADWLMTLDLDGTALEIPIVTRAEAENK